MPRDRAEPLQVCSPQRTPVLHVTNDGANDRNRTGIEKLGRFSPYQSASFAHVKRERAPRFELGWHGLEGRLLA